MKLKHAFHSPRPLWTDPGVGIEQTGGYGIPSCHTQYATTLCLLIVSVSGGFWVWLIAGILVLSIALNRVYLRVHFIHDVVKGFLVGLMLLVLAIVWQYRCAPRFNKLILGQRILAVFLLVLLSLPST